MWFLITMVIYQNWIEFVLRSQWVFFFFFSLPKFCHFLTKKLDFFDSVNSSNFAKVWLNLILLRGENKH